jgi:hypothetical protein
MATGDDEIKALRRYAAVGAAAIEQIPQLINRYLELTGQSQTKFGENAVGSADFVRHVRGGRDFRLSTALNALRHISDGTVFAKPVAPADVEPAPYP